MNIFVGSRMNDDTRRRELYQGSIFVHAPSRSAFQLCQLAHGTNRRGVCQRQNPLQRVHESLPVEKCVEILSVVKPKFIHHPKKAKEYIQDVCWEEDQLRFRKDVF